MSDEPISLAQRRFEKDPEQQVSFRPVLSFEEREQECKAEGCKDFVFGYEAGRLDTRLELKPERWEGTYHTENLDMLKRVADARSYDVAVEPSGVAGWVFLTFTPLAPARHLVPVPSGNP